MMMHWSPKTLFLLRLALGACALLAAAWLFGAIAEDVVNHDAPLDALDTQTSRWLHGHSQSALTSLMFACSAIGSPAVVLTIATAAALLAYRRRQAMAALLLVLAVPGGMLLNVLVKLLVHRQRPVFDDPILSLSSSSFPSGHAAGSTLLLGALAAIVIWHVRTWQLRVLAISAALLLVALICFSRIYLGVHFLSDVVAGFLEGCVWLGACLIAIEALHHGNIGRRPAL